MAWLIAHPRTTWSLIGLSGAVGGWGIGFSPIFIIFLAIAIGAPFWLWPRIGGRHALYAFITLGLPLCAALSIAYAQSIGCPANGVRVELKKDHPTVGCAEIRANYLAFAVLFGIVGLIGLAGPRIARSWDAGQAEEARLDDEYEAQLEADRDAGQILDPRRPAP